jgi:hypothetical protein
MFIFVVAARNVLISENGDPKVQPTEAAEVNGI